MNGQKDHDLLTRIDVNLSNFMRDFKEHTLGDSESFAAIKKELTVLNRYLWMIIGALALIELVSKWIH